MSIQKTLLALTIATALNGCGVQDSTDEKTDSGSNKTNTAPTVSLNIDFSSVKENESINIPFSAFDSDNDDMSFKVSASPIGTASISGQNIIYTSPNVSEDTTVTLTLTVNDGKVDVSTTGTFTVSNLTNTAPEIIAPETSFSFPENTNQIINFSISDADNDELSFRIIENTTGLNVSSRLAENTVILNIGEINSPSEVYSFSIFASDNQETSEKEFTVHITNNAENSTPVLTVNTTSINVVEDQDTTFSYSVVDEDTDVSNLTFEYELSDEIDANIFIDSINNQVIVSDMVTEYDRVVYLTLTVSDGFYSDSEVITLNIQNNLDQVYNELNSTFESVKNMYDSIKGKRDEEVFFDFYTRVASYLNPDAVSSVTTYRDKITQSLETSEASLTKKIDKILAYMNDKNRDNTLKVDYITMIEELDSEVRLHGQEAIEYLNEVSSILKVGLPTISETSKIEPFIVNSKEYYSRYVGNKIYGTLSSTSYEFSPQYKFMEKVNFLNESCN